MTIFLCKLCFQSMPVNIRNSIFPLFVKDGMRGKKLGNFIKTTIIFLDVYTSIYSRFSSSHYMFLFSFESLSLEKPFVYIFILFNFKIIAFCYKQKSSRSRRKFSPKGMKVLFVFKERQIKF